MWSYCKYHCFVALTKPYAQCIPYVSITHEMTRSLINILIKEMVGRNMSVAGEVCVLCVFMWI